jgi:hypothetical protein
LTELISCRVCGTLALPHQIDGRCHACGKLTCQNCYRICEGCTRIFCMNHIETKIVMRQQRPFLHKLCERCARLWL